MKGEELETTIHDNSMQEFGCQGELGNRALAGGENKIKRNFS